MSSLILRTAAKDLLPVMLLLSVVMLIQGHNEPGGGFVGGLLAASGFSLIALALGHKEAKRLLRVQPAALIGAGLGVATLSGVPGILMGQPFMTGQWTTIPVPGFPNGLKVGTPVMFDIGVYLLVMGVVLLMIFSLEEYRDDAAAGH